MTPRKIGLTVAIVAATGALVVGGAALANAATGTTTSGTPAPGTSQAPGGYGTAPRNGGGPGAPVHTAVTGDELAKVTAAVKAKDSAITVTSVRKDPDGSYDVFGTKSGGQVRYEVSADLKTITAGGPGDGHGGPGGPGGGPGGSADSAVTGAELARVSAAVTAKDSAVTVTSARKDQDGSYDVFGTKSGNPTRYEVSADLKTITEQAPGQPQGPGQPQ